MIDRDVVKQKAPFVSIAVIVALLIVGTAFAAMIKGSFLGPLGQLAPSAGSADGPIPEAPYVRFTEIVGTLNLNSSQKAKISTILLALHKQNAATADAGQRRANANNAHAEIETMLSPEQRSDLQAKLEARPPKTFALP